MRPSIICAIGLAGLAAATAEPADAESSTTITIRVTSTITTTSYVATETVTGTPPPNAYYQTGSPSVMSQVTMPASTLKTMNYGPGATANASATAAATGFSNSASSLLSSREIVLAGALSALSMVLSIL